MTPQIMTCTAQRLSEGFAVIIRDEQGQRVVTSTCGSLAKAVHNVLAFARFDELRDHEGLISEEGDHVRKDVLWCICGGDGDGLMLTIDKRTVLLHVQAIGT